MKKFLCYDTNDAASGKIGVNSNGVLSPNATVPSTNGTPYQQLVTDGKGGVKWEDRLAYEYTEWKDFTLSVGVGTEITGFTMPPVGDTVTIKVNGVESIETVKSGEIEGMGAYSYIGSVNPEEVQPGAEGWLVSYNDLSGVSGTANPETTISLLVTYQHKIDEKYIQQDKDIVRPLSYYIGDDGRLHKPYYNESGDEISTYKCSNIIMPKNETVFIYDNGDMGIGQFGKRRFHSFDVGVYKFCNGTIHQELQIYGTDETEIADLAADEGFTLTTKPTI